MSRRIFYIGLQMAHGTVARGLRKNVYQMQY